MKSRSSIPFLLSVLLASCENPPKPAGNQVSDSINIADSSVYAGYYEDSLPTGIIRLTISKSGEVRMVTDYLDYTPEVIQVGDLAEMDSNKVQISLVSVGSGDPVKDTMLFRKEGKDLVYVGSEGRTLTSKEKPIPATKQLIFWVTGQEECDRGPGMGKTICYRVVYGDKPLTGSPAPEILSDSIVGFTFEKGYVYKLKADRVPRLEPLRSRGVYQYKLSEIVEKLPVKY